MVSALGRESREYAESSNNSNRENPHPHNFIRNRETFVRGRERNSMNVSNGRELIRTYDNSTVIIPRENRTASIDQVIVQERSKLEAKHREERSALEVRHDARLVDFVSKYDQAQAKLKTKHEGWFDHLNTARADANKSGVFSLLGCSFSNKQGFDDYFDRAVDRFRSDKADEERDFQVEWAKKGEDLEVQLDKNSQNLKDKQDKDQVKFSEWEESVK